MHLVLTLAAHLTMPTVPLVAQAVTVESATPRDPDSTLADEPSVRIGMLDGPMEYIFGDVTGAIRLEDESVVVADEQTHNIRRYDASGRHMWTSGRQGEGPGEYGGLRLLRGCPGSVITVFDWQLDRITQLDPDGNLTDTRALGATGVIPYNEPACAPDGDLVFTPWPDRDPTVAAGEHYRWEMELELGTSRQHRRPAFRDPRHGAYPFCPERWSKKVGPEHGFRGRAHRRVVRLGG